MVRKNEVMWKNGRGEQYVPKDKVVWKYKVVKRVEGLRV